MSITIARIQPAVVIDDFQVQVPFTITSPSGSPVASGLFAYTRSGERVWAETAVDGNCVVSHKLDPNEPMNDFAVVAQETSLITALALPITTAEIDGIAAVVHAYITNGRPEWG